jgi:hypothetical protein
MKKCKKCGCELFNIIWNTDTYRLSFEDNPAGKLWLTYDKPVFNTKPKFYCANCYKKIKFKLKDFMLKENILKYSENDLNYKLLQSLQESMQIYENEEQSDKEILLISKYKIIEKRYDKLINKINKLEKKGKSLISKKIIKLNKKAEKLETKLHKYMIKK